MVLLSALAVALAVLAFIAAPASAAITRPLQETFGSAQEQTFVSPTALAFDQSQGNLIVGNGGFQGRLSRFDEEGNPVSFSALGTNVIDGRKGPGGKPCAQEPESCDATPQENIAVGSASETDIAIDESGGITDGNIYVNQSSDALVDIFAADGHYLGQLTKAGTASFSEVCGVAVDSNGAVYAGDFLGGIFKFIPTANPPVNSDNAVNITSVSNPCTLAAGAGPTAGALFINQFEGAVYKVDIASDTVKYTVSPGEGHTTETVDPVSGHVLVAKESEVAEYDASGNSSAQKLTEVHSPNTVTGVAVNDAQDLVYASNGETGKVEVFGPPPPVPVVFTGAASNLSGTAATLNATVNPREAEVESCIFEWGETAAPYEHTVPCIESSSEIGEGSGPVPVHADISGLTGGTVYHFRLVATNSVGAGEGEDKTFATPAPPLISGETVQSVARTEATVIFKVNPMRYPTSYRIEYGQAGGPYDQSTGERGVGSDGVDHALTFTLEGLTPGTSYQWRVVATNADPAFPGTGTIVGGARTFHTHGTFEPNTDCTNRTFRTGAGAILPDCRAYENGFSGRQKWRRHRCFRRPRCQGLVQPGRHRRRQDDLLVRHSLWRYQGGPQLQSVLGDPGCERLDYPLDQPAHRSQCRRTLQPHLHLGKFIQALHP